MSYPLIHTIHKEKEKKEQKKKEKPLLLSLIKREHFYLAQKRTFLNCVDTREERGLDKEKGVLYSKSRLGRMPRLSS